MLCVIIHQLSGFIFVVTLKNGRKKRKWGKNRNTVHITSNNKASRETDEKSYKKGGKT
jgi:hypothetical protein